MRSVYVTIGGKQVHSTPEDAVFVRTQGEQRATSALIGQASQAARIATALAVLGVLIALAVWRSRHRHPH